MNRIKPTETVVYNGVKFKSELEACWAVFFDECGVEWEYEPQGFILGDGVGYIPDFLLHNIPMGFVNDDHPTHWKTDELGNHYFDGELDGRPIIKNLWVEVKETLDEESAEKIKQFRKYLDEDSCILVVGKMPSPKEDDWLDVFEKQMENDGCNDVYFYQLDGKWKGILEFPGVDKTGTMGIYGTYKWFSRVGWDLKKTDQAYFNARNYRFDHEGF